MPHAEKFLRGDHWPFLVELEGAALHWLKLRLIVPANSQLPLQRTMYDRKVTYRCILATGGPLGLGALGIPGLLI